MQKYHRSDRRRREREAVSQSVKIPLSSEMKNTARDYESIRRTEHAGAIRQGPSNHIPLRGDLDGLPSRDVENVLFVSAKNLNIREQWMGEYKSVSGKEKERRKSWRGRNRGSCTAQSARQLPILLFRLRPASSPPIQLLYASAAPLSMQSNEVRRSSSSFYRMSTCTALSGQFDTYTV